MRYMAGTISKVMKKANNNPQMMVSDKGFQNTALSPPKKICGFKSVNRVTKLILKPTASGINARMAASAVSNTGTILVFPASMTASLVFMPRPLNSSANSITRIPFFTTMLDSPTIPISVVTSSKGTHSVVALLGKNIEKHGKSLVDGAKIDANQYK